MTDDGQDDLRDTHLPSREERTAIRQLYSETYPVKLLLAYILVQTERIRELEALLTELTDIEGPQPGHLMWYRKVQAALGREGEP